MASLLAQTAEVVPSDRWFELIRNPESAVFIFLTIVSVVGILAGMLSGYFRHREKMLRLEERIAMIERGMDPDAPRNAADSEPG